MNVLHSGSLDVRSGGPALSTYLSMKGLINSGVEAEIIMPPLNEEGKLIADDLKIHYTEPIINTRFGYMPHLNDSLKNLGKYDLYHVQGVWQYLGHGVASYARKKGKPYLLTLRGMMYPQALQKSAWIKKISLALYQREDLQKVACIQATCVEERDYYRQLGFTNPVAVIPNPIDCANYLELPISKKEKIRIGYLGRVHSRKRIERLIYVFDKLREQTKDCELLIIGADDKIYEDFLKEEVKRLQLANVFFTGFLTGAEKEKVLFSLSYLMVPSDFENFGNIVTEALVRGIPVIASKGTPWQDLESHHCGWWVNNDVDTLADTLKTALSLPEEERLAMGERGKELIKENYSVEIVAQKMKRLYKWILEGGEKPEFVYEKI